MKTPEKSDKATIEPQMTIESNEGDIRDLP